MSQFSQDNTINTAVSGPRQGKDPLEACFPSASKFFYGFQPFNIITGQMLCQGTTGFNMPKWRLEDWIVNSIGGAGTTLTPLNTYPNRATFVTRATSDGDGYNIQWGDRAASAAVKETFTPTANTTIWAYGVFKVDNASTDAHTKSRFYFGLGDVDTDVHGSVLEFMGFYKASGAATMIGILDETAQDATAALANSVVDNTFIQLGMRVNGVTSVEFWQGTGVKPADMSRMATITDVTDLPSTDLSLSFQGETSEAVAITYTLDTLVAFQGTV
jgi:hypothetical protein